ncbi:hypothetical protein LIER_19580 [Lithospermum erythrorhizon]|uniref:Uncharacterized protein n=1 Tax=Lithospermum erythrorhizon TaxID=34254 RepID=A0AAV3QKL1_LITER
MAQDLQRAEERRRADLQRAEKRMLVTLHAAQFAGRERDDLLIAYHQEIPIRNCRSGASVLADLVLNNQSRLPQLTSFVEE